MMRWDTIYHTNGYNYRQLVDSLSSKAIMVVFFGFVRFWKVARTSGHFTTSYICWSRVFRWFPII